MTKVTFYKDKNDKIKSFKVRGHAGYAEYGSDIVCAAISALVINTINSIDSFTKVSTHIEMDEDTGFISLEVNEYDEKANLLLLSLLLGLQNIEKDYRNYLKIIIRREP